MKENASANGSRVQRFRRREAQRNKGTLLSIKRLSTHPSSTLVCAEGQAIERGRVVGGVMVAEPGGGQELEPLLKGHRLPSKLAGNGVVSVSQGSTLTYFDAGARTLRSLPTPPGRIEQIAVHHDRDDLAIVTAGETLALSAVEGSGAGTKRSSWTPAAVGPGQGIRVNPGVRKVWILADQLRRLIPVELDVDVWNVCWFGANGLALIVSQGAQEDDWYLNELRLITLDGAAGVLTTSEGYVPVNSRATRVQLGSVSGSRDGRWVAALAGLSSDRGLVAGELHVVDHAGHGRIEPLTFDATHVRFTAGNRLWLAGIRGLDTVVASSDLKEEGGLAVQELILPGGGPHYPEVSDLRGSCVTIVEDYTSPPRVVVISRDRAHPSGALKLVGNHNGPAWPTEYGSAERVRWTSSDGQTVEGVLVSPAGTGPHPLVVHLHGGPAYAWRPRYRMGGNGLTPLLVSLGACVLYPNPRGSTGRGQDWVSRVLGDVGGRDADDVISAITWLCDIGKADPQRIALYGNSYGGYLSSWIPVRYPHIAAAVPTSAVTDWRVQHLTSNIPTFDQLWLTVPPDAAGARGVSDRASAASPLAYADRIKTPMLLAAGAQDVCVSPVQATALQRAITEAGGTASTLIYPFEGHGFGASRAADDFVERLVAFLAEHLRLE